MNLLLQQQSLLDTGSPAFAFAVLALHAIVAATWAFQIARHTKPGFVRSLLLLPTIVSHFALPPLLVDHKQYMLLVQGMTCVLSTSAFKLIALCMGRGALVAEVSFWRFYGVLTLPVIPADNGSTTGLNEPSTTPDGKPISINAEAMLKVQRGLLKLGAFALVSFMGLQMYVARQGNRHPLLMYLMYTASGAGLWMEVDGMGDLLDAVALRVYGIRADKHFDKPFMATSLAELWSRRWNITISAVLRAMVYDPVIEGRLVTQQAKQGSITDSAPATQHSSDLSTCSTSSVYSTSSSTSQLAAVPQSKSLPDGTTTAQSKAGTPTPAADVAEATPAACTDFQSTARREAVALEPAGSSTCVSPSGSPAKQQPATAALVQATAVPPEKPSRRRGPSIAMRTLGTTLTFLVSGLWHELVFYFMMGHMSSGHWLLFFLLQAPLMVAEQLIKVLGKKAGIKLPRWATCVLVNLVFTTTIALLWFPPMEQSGMFDIIMRQAQQDLARLQRQAQSVMSAAASTTLASRYPAAAELLDWIQVPSGHAGTGQLG